MKIKRVDSLVIYTQNLARSARFYHEVFDLPLVSQTKTAQTFHLGHQLLHLRSLEDVQLPPQSKTPGSLCLSIVAADCKEAILNHCKSYFVPIVQVNEQTTGADGACWSIILQDPDENLIEVITYK